MAEQPSGDGNFTQRFEEMIAAVAHLRFVNSKLRRKLKRSRRHVADLRESVNALTADNSRLRERLSAKRKDLPADVMSFGKYEGTPVVDVPTSYLEWCLETVFTETELRRKQSKQLWECIKHELARRASGTKLPDRQTKRRRQS